MRMAFETQWGKLEAGPMGLVLRLGRLGLVGILAGVVAGIIAGGVGSRVAMRILAAANGELDGVVTDNGNVVGEITFGGTLDLILISGFFVGTFGGLFYVLTRRWVPGSGIWKGLAFGLMLFLVFGSFIIDDGNRDFRLFGPAALAVALFALLFPLYGLLVSPLADRLYRYVPSLFAHPAVTVAGGAILLGLCAFGAFHDFTSIKAIAS